MLVANDHDEPYEEESHPCQLGHLKSPGYVRYIVQDNIRQWGIPDDHVRSQKTRSGDYLAISGTRS